MKLIKKLILSTLVATIFVSQSNAMLPAEQFAEDYFAIPENNRPSHQETTQAFMRLKIKFPLHKAARCGLSTVLSELIRAGFDVNQTDDGTTTSLQRAIAANQTEAALVLIHTPGININAQDNVNLTPLQLAVSHRNYIVVKELLGTAGIIVNLRDFRKFTPLKIAKRMGLTQIIKLLTEAGATE